VSKILVVLAGSLALASCANTVNLLNPNSPRFEGAFAAPVPDSSVGRAPRLRVVSFNIKMADRIGSAIEVLRSDSLRDADIISLQEMDEAGTERIARELHLNYVYYPGSIHPARNRYFGPAILSRWPIERSWKLNLPYEAPVRRQRRNATAAVVNVRGERVTVYAVHLETQFRASARTREEQVATVLADAKSAAGPVVVAGDFNSWGIGEYFRQRGFSWPTRDVGKTIAVFSWDHIFVRGLPLATPTAAGKVVDVHGASDHKPVWASLLLGQSGRKRPSPSAPVT
jgi:endonuclease/exonuclease/phosphatase family metal-dependent hydrolase